MAKQKFAQLAPFVEKPTAVDKPDLIITIQGLGSYHAASVISNLLRNLGATIQGDPDERWFTDAEEDEAFSQEVKDALGVFYEVADEEIIRIITKP